MSCLPHLGTAHLSSSGTLCLPPFETDEGHSTLGNRQCSRTIFGIFFRSLPGYSPVSQLWSQFFRPQGLVFTLILSAGLLCGSINQVLSVDITTGE